MKPVLFRQDLAIESLQLKKAALILRDVNHKLRMQMLLLIHQKKSLSVTDIYVQLRLEQSVASQHLSILRKAGFVRTERSGKQIFYSINYSWLKEVQVLSAQLIG